MGTRRVQGNAMPNDPPSKPPVSTTTRRISGRASPPPSPESVPRISLHDFAPATPLAPTPRSPGITLLFPTVPLRASSQPQLPSPLAITPLPPSLSLPYPLASVPVFPHARRPPPPRDHSPSPSPSLPFPTLTLPYCVAFTFPLLPTTPLPPPPAPAASSLLPHCYHSPSTSPSLPSPLHTRPPPPPQPHAFPFPFAGTMLAPELSLPFPTASHLLPHCYHSPSVPNTTLPPRGHSPSPINITALRRRILTRSPSTLVPPLPSPIARPPLPLRHLLLSPLLALPKAHR
ncbi:unnamed protein product [Closterium sp. NIES-64]|nr:unnamed protein product [Closterium sp. NIES-64]